MQLKQTAIQRILATGILSIALVSGSSFTMAIVLSSSTPSYALELQSREQVVDGVTDWLFGTLHPDLNRRKLRADEFEYIREWQVIRAVIDQGGLHYTETINPKVADSHWWFSNRDEAVKDRLADALFFHRHPERTGAPIGSDEIEAIREWTKLKDAMWVPVD